MGGEDIHFVVVFEQQWPVLRLDLRPALRRLDCKLLWRLFLLGPHFLLDQFLLAFVLGHGKCC